MIRHVVTTQPVQGTELDPAAARGRRAKLIARAEELLPKQAAQPASAPVDVAAQLKQAMAANAFGSLRFSGRDPVEVVDELRAAWRDEGPMFDDADRAQLEQFDEVCRRVLEAAGAAPERESREPRERRRRGRGGSGEVPVPVPVEREATAKGVGEVGGEAVAPTAPAEEPSAPVPVPIVSASDVTTRGIGEVGAPIVPVPIAMDFTARGIGDAARPPAEPLPPPPAQPRTKTPTVQPSVDEVDTGWDLGDADPTVEQPEPEPAPTPSASEIPAMARPVATGSRTTPAGTGHRRRDDRPRSCVKRDMTPRWPLALAALAGCTHPKYTPSGTGTGTPLAAVVDPDLIEMTAEPTTSLVTATAASELGVRVRITARALPAANRPPLDLALVLDTSGSMDGDAIDALRASAREVVGKMRDGDRIAVVAFHSKVDVLVPTTPLDASTRARIDRAIAQIRARGTTDLVGGLAAGAQQVQAAGVPDAIHRIVLLSDGVPNQAAQLPQLIAQLHTQQIAVTTLGFGIDYDTAVMTRIANDTGGNFHYVDKPEEIAAVFDDELAKMQTVVARNLALVLAPGPGVSFRPMPGIAFVGDGRIAAQIGDLSAGETRDLMIPIDACWRAAAARPSRSSTRR